MPTGGGGAGGVAPEPGQLPRGHVPKVARQVHQLVVARQQHHLAPRRGRLCLTDPPRDPLASQFLSPNRKFWLAESRPGFKVILKMKRCTRSIQ